MYIRENEIIEDFFDDKEEELIAITDNLNIAQKRHFLKMSEVMVRCINQEEFLEICDIYDKALDRLLSEI